MPLAIYLKKNCNAYNSVYNYYTYGFNELLSFGEHLSKELRLTPCFSFQLLG